MSCLKPGTASKADRKGLKSSIQWLDKLSSAHHGGEVLEATVLYLLLHYIVTSVASCNQQDYCHCVRLTHADRDLELCFGIADVGGSYLERLNSLGDHLINDGLGRLDVVNHGCGLAQQEWSLVEHFSLTKAKKQG